MLRTPVFENKICKICIAKYANFILFLSSLLISEGLFFDYEPEFRVSGTTPEWKIKPIQEIKLTDLRRYQPSKEDKCFSSPLASLLRGRLFERIENHNHATKGHTIIKAQENRWSFQAGWIIKRSIYIVLSFCSLRGRRKKERGKGEEKREGWVFVTFLPCACLSFRDGPLETLWGGTGIFEPQELFSKRTKILVLCPMTWKQMQIPWWCVHCVIWNVLFMTFVPRPWNFIS